MDEQPKQVVCCVDLATLVTEEEEVNCQLPTQMPDPEVLGARLLSHEAVEVAKSSAPTDFINHRQIASCVDLSPLVKEEEVNYLRLRYNEYLLQCASMPFELDTKLDQRQEEMASREDEIRLLLEEVDKVEMERRNSGEMLAREVLDHQQRNEQLEREVAALKNEILKIKGVGGNGAEGFSSGMRKKIMEEVEGALQDLEQLESEIAVGRHKLQELEDEEEKKLELLSKSQKDLDGIRSSIASIDKDREMKISQIKESIASKESELTQLKLEIKALKACKSKLQEELDSTHRETDNLKENVHEKDKIISVYKSDNQKITDELENLRRLLNQNDLVARKEMEEAVATERRLSQQLNSAQSEKEQEQIKRKLSELEKELAQKRLVHEETRAACHAMEAEIQSALDALDNSEARMKALAAESGAFRESSTKTIEALQQRNKEVEAALDEMKRKADANTGDLGQEVAQGLDSVLDTLRKTNQAVQENKYARSFEKDRLEETLNELDAMDEVLSTAEALILERGGGGSRQRPEITPTAGYEGLFLRYYPIFLTVLFLFLSVSGHFFYTGSWNMWMPFFLASVLSFALPHPFGAIASLLAAFVVAASFFLS